MHFRIALPADVAALNLLVNSAYRGESSKKGWTTEADLLDGIRTSETSLSKMIANPQAVVILGEENNELLGCVYCEKKFDHLYLGMLTVKPDRQANGIGAQLMVEAEKQAVEWSCTQIRMTVITARHELIEYYMRKGFVDTDEREPFPTDPAFGIPKQDLQFLVMAKSLT